MLPLRYPYISASVLVGLPSELTSDKPMVTYKPVYNRKNQLADDGKSLVQIEAYQNGQRRYYSTGVRLLPKEWDEKRGEAKNNGLATRKIRAKIDELERFEVSFPTVHGRPFTLRDFDLLYPKKTVTPISQADAPATFSAYMLAQIELDKTKFRTVDAYSRKLRVSKRLDKYNGGPVALDGLTYAFVVGFDQHLRNKYGHHDNTIHKEHQVLREYLIRAIKSGLIPITGNPYDQFKAKRKPVDKDAFTPMEIQRIENLTLTAPDKQHLAFYRDAFLLAYYTALRVSDLVSLSRKHIQETSDGLLLTKDQKKTERIVRIPLRKLHRLPDQVESKPERILKAYWRTDDEPFFERAEVNMQEYVKDVF